MDDSRLQAPNKRILLQLNMLIYNFFILVYGLGIRLFALFNEKAKKWVHGRKKNLSNLPNVANRNVVWFHCASLGEFDQALPIIESWDKKDFILVTFFSPSGYENKKNFQGADYICYLPLDTPKNARQFVKHFSPKKVFFIKYEFWLNYIDQLHELGAKIYSLSTVLRPNQHFFKWYGGIFVKRLKKFHYFFVQNKVTADLLNSLGVEKVKITGDTRYDRVLDRKNKISPNEQIKNWLNGEKAFVIGSSWAKDEELLLPILKNLNCKIIIAPHEVNEKNIQRLKNSLTDTYFCYSKLKDKKDPIPIESKILILDCIGVLAEAYYFGKFAYIGGGFGTGLHNILEPAAFGLPVAFGPIYKKFPEAEIFLQIGIAKSISSIEDIESTIQYFEKNYDTLAEKINSFMSNNSGAKEKVIQLL